MPPLHLWLSRPPADAPALILPGGTLSYGEARAWPKARGLLLPQGAAPDIGLALLAAGLGGGSVFPLPPGLADAHRRHLLTLAEAEAHPRLALIVATSGSAGAPKGVKLPWRAVAAAARMGAASARLGPGDVWLACLPLHHIGGLMIPYRCWRAGAAALIHDGFDTAAILRDLQNKAVSHVSLVPAMLDRLVEAGERPSATLRYALVGGAALPLALFRRAVDLGWPVCPTYGMTETCSSATVWVRPGRDEWTAGAVGRPLPGVRLQAGETLAVASPARMTGYLGARPAGEWMETRDLGRIDASGGVHVLGRADDMLISAGVKVHPLALEERLSACPGVREVGVAGCPDPTWGQRIAAVYEGEASADQVENWCREHLPASSRPRRFRRVSSLPRTASGKLDRQALAALAEVE